MKHMLRALQTNMKTGYHRTIGRSRNYDRGQFWSNHTVSLKVLTFLYVFYLFLRKKTFFKILQSDWTANEKRWRHHSIKNESISCDILVPVLIPDTCDAREFDEFVLGKFPEVPPYVLFPGQALPARKSWIEHDRNLSKLSVESYPLLSNDSWRTNIECL